jgi:8-hydroxy-5-deazaflavin:NADPH oxidoreductase
LEGTVEVTIVGTGNMARGIGRRVLVGGHELTVIGKDSERTEAVAADLGGAGTVKTAVTGDPIEGDLVVLAVYYADARVVPSGTPTSSPGRSSWTSPTP